MCQETEFIKQSLAELLISSQDLNLGLYKVGFLKSFDEGTFYTMEGGGEREKVDSYWCLKRICCFAIFFRGDMGR
jgi:hypothetical protein